MKKLKSRKGYLKVAVDRTNKTGTLNEQKIDKIFFSLHLSAL